MIKKLKDGGMVVIDKSYILRVNGINFCRLISIETNILV